MHMHPKTEGERQRSGRKCLCLRRTCPRRKLYVGRMAAFGSVTVCENLTVALLTASKLLSVIVIRPPYSASCISHGRTKHRAEAHTQTWVCGYVFSVNFVTMPCNRTAPSVQEHRRVGYVVPISKTAPSDIDRPSPDGERYLWYSRSCWNHPIRAHRMLAVNQAV